jgi:hypothetical protein
MKCFIKNLLSALCFLPSALPLNACPLCKEAIAEISGMARGFSLSILLMLGVLMAVVSVISLIVVRAYRKASNLPERPSQVDIR